MGWLVMKCPDFTASQFAFNFEVFAADIYRKLMLLSCRNEEKKESSSVTHAPCSLAVCDELAAVHEVKERELHLPPTCDPSLNYFNINSDDEINVNIRKMKKKKVSANEKKNENDIFKVKSRSAREMESKKHQRLIKLRASRDPSVDN